VEGRFRRRSSWLIFFCGNCCLVSCVISISCIDCLLFLRVLLERDFSEKRDSDVGRDVWAYFSFGFDSLRPLEVSVDMSSCLCLCWCCDECATSEQHCVELRKAPPAESNRALSRLWSGVSGVSHNLFSLWGAKRNERKTKRP
jgi:hypothetical protein